MIQDKHTLTEKKFYNTRKALDKLQEEMYNLPYRKLDEPYQEGWFLRVVLREDIERSPKGAALNELLKLFGKRDMTRNAKHVSEIRRKPLLETVHRLQTKWRYSMYQIGIKAITEMEYNKLPEGLKKYFSIVSNFISKSVYGSRIMYEHNIPTYYFLVKVDKRIVTHVQDINPAMKKKEAELKKILEPFWRTISNGEGSYHYFERRSERRQSKVDLSKIGVELE